MFLAFSAGLRSADLSRQVGAVIMSGAGDLIAVGTNEVPLAGGGLCWAGPHDHRDLTRGYDTNEQQRKDIVDEILVALRPEAVDIDVWKRRGWRLLKDAAVMNITEYGRAVHAEMEAVLSCARSGISPRGATLFSTTFPCHNCAKHIIAAGLQRVVYVEPYPKSKAAEMYPQSIKLAGTAEEGSVLFEPFRGLGPRRFFDVFSIGLSSGYAIKRKQDGKVRLWEPGSAEVRVPMVPTSYISREARAAEKLLATVALRKEPQK
jgi:deoxycytidylate deaminase